MAAMKRSEKFKRSWILSVPTVYCLYNSSCNRTFGLVFNQSWCDSWMSLVTAAFVTGEDFIRETGKHWKGARPSALWEGSQLSELLWGEGETALQGDISLWGEGPAAGDTAGAEAGEAAAQSRAGEQDGDTSVWGQWERTSIIQHIM